MNSSSSPVDSIRGFVRGTYDWHALADLGVAVVIGPKGAEINTPASLPVVEVSRKDLAAGLLIQIDHGSEQIWSQIVLGCGAIGMESLHVDRHGEELLELIWDSAFGVTPKRSRIEGIAARIASEIP